ncbi:hypothetical protein NBRC116583_06070 [Arenicella sp. 4NH20-0111]|uniref:cupin domain-containing protein n=1 Tax=Arenicella sp. 4NH20-0111 TaxID=3127648 RepID=UPI0031072D69
MLFSQLDDTTSDKGVVSDYTLKNILRPLTATQFFDDYWEQKPFIIKRRNANYYKSVLNLETLNEVFASRIFRAPDMRIFNNGEKKAFHEFSKKNKANGNVVLKEFENGSTIIFENLDRNHLPLAKLIRNLENELHIDLRTNVYLTPAKATGFKAHWDTHCVLVMQVHGTKKWEIYDNPVPLPTENQKYSPKTGDQANHITSFLMEEGDIAYIPRGFVHQASAQDQASLHVTMGLRPLTVKDLLREVVNNVCKENVSLRNGILPKGDFDEGTLRDALVDVMKTADLGKYREKLYKKYILERYPILDTQLKSVVESSAIEQETGCKVKPHMVWKLFENESFVSLLFDGKSVHFPKEMKPSLSFFERGDAFSVDQIPGLDLRSRQILAQRLVHEGFLEVH